MVMQLFKLDSADPLLEKESSLSVQLTNPPEDWDQEILDYTYRMFPWLSEFSLSVEFAKKVADRQYGVGSIQVLPKKPMVPATPSRAIMSQAEKEGPLLAHIPVIIKEGVLSPIDVFITDGDVSPLDEDTFRKRVSSDLNSNKTSPQRSDPTLIGHLWPPGRSSFGGPGSELGISVLNKFSSNEEDNDFYFFKEMEKLGHEDIDALEEGAGFPILRRFTTGESKVNMEKVADLNSVIQDSSLLRPIFGEPLQKVIANLPPRMPKKGSVVQIMRSPDGNMVRATDPHAFSFGPSMPVNLNDLLDRDPTIYCTCAASAKIKPSEAKAVLFDYPALCATSLKDGNRTRQGFLFSTVIDLDGLPTGNSLFFDMKRENWCLENQMYATAGKELTEFPGDSIGGTGVFMCQGEKGVVCTVPFTVYGTEQTRDGTCYKVTVHGSRISGAHMPVDAPLKLYIAQGIRQPAFSGRSNVLIMPASFSWVKIGDTKFRPFVPLKPDRGVVKVTKLAGDSYMLEGGPVTSVVSEPLNEDDTSYVLAAAGVSPDKIGEVLKVAEGGVTIVDCNSLKRKEPLAAKLPDLIDTDLLKAAAVVNDPNTVDSVLGLNMMDAELESNHMLLAQELEKTQQKIARLLLLSRLGLYTIPEGATKLVMTRLNPIIDSLKILSLQNSYKH